MNQQELLLLISKYFSRFNEQVKILNGNSEFSINIHAENILIKILNIIYDCDFENVNYSENKNYDSIDLRDKSNKMSVQVTATSNISKVKDTLTKYVSNKHYETYNELKMLILTGRQKNYSQDSIDATTNGKVNFKENIDIIDFTNLYVELNRQNELTKILAVKELLEQQFSDTTIKATVIQEVNSFNELCKIIEPFLIENENIFLSFGPNSGTKSEGPVRWDLTLWYKARREKILPNNKVIVDLLEINKKLIPENYKDIVFKFKNHVFAFEKHCVDSFFDYSEFLFPKEFSNIIKDECK